MANKRILFTLHNFYPKRLYGAEKICIDQMREFLKRGYKVGLFYSCNSAVSREELKTHGLESVALFRVGFSFSRTQVLLSAWKPHVTYQFRRAVKEFAPDIIIFHHLVRLSMDLPLVVARNNEIKTVFYLHDFYLVCPAYSLLRAGGTICRKGDPVHCATCLMETRFGNLARGVPLMSLPGIPFLVMRNRVVKKLIKRIDYFVSPSRFLVSELKERGLEVGRFIHIPNGMDPVTRKTRGKKSGPLIFGYLGNMHRKKGVHVLLEAFRGELGERLVIRGFSGDEALRDFRKRYPFFKGTLEIFSSDIQSFYDNVDVIVVPSIWYENQPTVIMEAFNFQKPVICSDTGGMPEMVADKRWGLLFKKGDSEDLRQKVMWMIDNPDEVDKMKAAIPDWPTVGDNVDRLIKKVF